jgi:hypothetical protein
MSDTVIITLIVAVAVLVVLYIFRNQLKDFIFNVNKENGLHTELHTHDPQPTPQNHQGAASSSQPAPRLSVSGNTMRGRDQEIAVRHTDAAVDNNKLIGRNQDITVTTPDPRIVYLHQHITENFSVNDFRTLCLKLDVDPAAFPVSDLPNQTTALLDQIQAQNRLPALIAAGREIRPNLDWED